MLPHVADIEAKKPGLMRELLQKAGEVGLLGHDVPEEFGGLGGDKTSSSLITEAASRLGSFAVSFGAHVGIGTMPIVLFGTAEQRKKYLPKLATGELIAAYALTEPGSGSDALAAKTKAVLVGRTARAGSSPARSSTSPTPASPTCSRCSPRWTASSSPASSSNGARPA